MDVNLKNADLDGADLRGADLKGINLQGATLKGAKFDEKQIIELEESNYDLQDVFIEKEGQYISYMDYCKKIISNISDERGGADKKLDFHGLRKELDHYVFSGQNQHRITGLSPVRFCN